MHPWHMLLADRIYTTPGLAARGVTKGNPVVARATPLTADHVAVCVVLARMLKRGRSLALILPQLGVEDVVAIAHYLTTLRDVVVASQTLPGPYATPARLRDQPCLRVISSNPEVCRQLRVPSYQTTGSATDFIDVISAKAAITHPAERYPPPFAELIDLTAQPPGVDPLSLLPLTPSLGAIPRYVLAPLGNKHALLELRKQHFAIWLHRAGDARILSEIEELKPLNPIPDDQSTAFSRHCMALRSGMAVTVRQLAMDRCSATTAQAWRLIKDLDYECTNSGRELIRIARGLLRFLGALAVPLPLYERTAHADHRMGRYAARQVSREYDTLATLPVPNGQAEALRQELLTLLHQIIAMLNAPDALSAKAAALLHWLRTTLDEQGAIEIVCPTTVMAKALREWLAQQGWDATGADPQLCVRTRREAWQAGQQGNVAESLDTVLLEALDFYSGVWFSGVRCHVLLWCYQWETNALYRQLDFIAHDTQLSSFPTGDKAALLCGLKEACPDQRVAESVEPAWQVTRLHDPSVGRYPILPSPPPTPLALPELDWLLAQLEQPAEPITTTTAPTTIDMSQQLRLIVDDGGPPVLLAPHAEVLAVAAKLDELCDQDHWYWQACDLQIGMTIVLDRAAPSQPLLDRLEERLNDPTLLVARRLAELWQSAVVTLATQCARSSSDGLKLIQQHGATIRTPSAVAHWFTNPGIGPREWTTLRAVACATGNRLLMDQTDQIWKAMRLLRGTRQRLGRLITMHVRRGAGYGPNESVIDNSLRLYRSDLAELTRVARIIAIDRTGEHTDETVDSKRTTTTQPGTAA